MEFWAITQAVTPDQFKIGNTMYLQKLPLAMLDTAHGQEWHGLWKK